MKRINSLSDLLIEELSDLLGAQNQLLETLPKLTGASESSALKVALEDYLKITGEHAGRLQDIFSNIGQNPLKMAGKTMKGLMAEFNDIVSTKEKSLERDAAIISVIQRVEEYEIAGYKLAYEHAAHLGHTRIEELLTKSLNEQRAMKFHLNELAQVFINLQAIKPKSKGFYIPEGKFDRGGIKRKKMKSDVGRFFSEGNPNTQDE